MANIKSNDGYRKPPKNAYQLYSLQSLPAGKFVEVMKKARVGYVTIYNGTFEAEGISNSEETPDTKKYQK